MQLKGLTVAVTGSRRASELAHLISNFGGIPYVAPKVGIEVEEEVDRQLEDLVRRIVGGDVDYAVFMTGPWVYRLMATAERLGVEGSEKGPRGDSVRDGRGGGRRSSLCSHRRQLPPKRPKV